MFYACNLDCDLGKASPWVRENVLPQLPPFGGGEWCTREQIRDGILDYLGRRPVPTELKDLEEKLASYRPEVAVAEPPEFWAYFADYDWVAFCQLWGRMIDLPKGFPMFCLDVKQIAHMRGLTAKDVGLAKPGNEHDALADALWTRELYRKLMT